MPSRPNSLAADLGLGPRPDDRPVVLVEVGERADPRRAASPRPAGPGVERAERRRRASASRRRPPGERAEQVFLVGEVEVEGAVRGLRELDDVVDAGGVVAPASRTPRRRRRGACACVRCPRARSSRVLAPACPSVASCVAPARASAGPARRGTRAGYADPTPVSPFGALGLTVHGARRYALTPTSGGRRSRAVSATTVHATTTVHGRRRAHRRSSRNAHAAPMFVQLRGRVGRLQPDAPRRHDRGPGRQPVGVRPRHAHDGARGPGREGLVRPRGDAPVPGALLQAGVAGRRAHVHRRGHRQARRGRRAARRPRARRSRTRTATRRSPARPPRRRSRRADRGAARRTRRGRHRIGARHRPRVRAVLRRARAPSVVVNDVGVSLDGRGTEDDPAAQVCKEIEALGGEAVPNYDSVTDFDGAGRHRADRGRRVRHDRHPRQQRRASCATSRC